MDDNLKDILSNLNKEIEQEKLLDYLNKNLAASEVHDLEKQMADDPFMNDAVEGLQQMRSTKDMQAYVQQLNDDLHKQLAKKKTRREKRKLKDQSLLYITIVILLVLAVVGYLMIKQMKP